MWRDLLGGISIESAIYLFVVDYSARDRVHGVMLPITLASLLAGTDLVVMVVLVVLSGVSLFQNHPNMFRNVMLGFLIGLGPGVGIHVSTKIEGPINERT